MKTVKRTLKKSFFQLSAFKICIVYLIIGLTWVLFSDSFIFLISSRDDVIHWLSTIKGFLYVFVTGIILYGLIRYYINESEERQIIYQGVVENAGSIIIKTDRNLNITVFNEYAEQIFEKNADEVLDTSLQDLFRHDTLIPDEWKQIFRFPSLLQENTTTAFEMEYINPEHPVIWILWTITYTKRTKEMDESLLLIGTDISSQKSTEKALFLTNKAIQTISYCNRAIIHESDEESLLHAVCQILVKTGGHRLAWIGYTQNDEQNSLIQMAYSGIGQGCLNSLTFPEGDVFQGGEPCHEAVLTGSVQVRKYPETYVDNQNPEKLKKREYASSTALPLREADRTFGVLSIYSTRTDAFDEKETAMLEGLADDIAYGIYTIRTREKLKSAQIDLAQSEERLRLAMDATNDGLWDWNVVTGDAVSSRRYATMLEYEQGDFPESFATWVTLVHPSDIATVTSKLDFALKTGKEFSAEFRMRTKSGGWKWILSRGIVVSWDENHHPLRMVGTNIDIDERKATEQQLQQAAQELRNAMVHIDKNLNTLSALNDMIRNPLTVLAILADDTSPDIQEKLMTQIKVIDQIISELDKGWIESEKVRNYLKKHHEFN